MLFKKDRNASRFRLVYIPTFFIVFF